MLVPIQKMYCAIWNILSEHSWVHFICLKHSVRKHTHKSSLPVYGWVHLVVRFTFFRQNKVKFIRTKKVHIFVGKFTFFIKETQHPFFEIVEKNALYYQVHGMNHKKDSLKKDIEVHRVNLESWTYKNIEVHYGIQCKNQKNFLKIESLYLRKFNLNGEEVTFFYR